jgi:hypothetical protein
MSDGSWRLKSSRAKNQESPLDESFTDSSWPFDRQLMTLFLSYLIRYDFWEMIVCLIEEIYRENELFYTFVRIFNQSKINSDWRKINSMTSQPQSGIFRWSLKSKGKIELVTILSMFPIWLGHTRAALGECFRLLLRYWVSLTLTYNQRGERSRLVHLSFMNSYSLNDRVTKAQTELRSKCSERYLIRCTIHYQRAIEGMHVSHSLRHFPDGCWMFTIASLCLLNQISGGNRSLKRSNTLPEYQLKNFIKSSGQSDVIRSPRSIGSSVDA